MGSLSKKVEDREVVAVPAKIVGTCFVDIAADD